MRILKERVKRVKDCRSKVVAASSPRSKRQSKIQHILMIVIRKILVLP